jgi:L-cysteate sulfo-lyase
MRPESRKQVDGVRYRDLVATSDVLALRRRLDAHPRVRLAHLPTPLEPLHRLRERIGGPPIFIKRDDCTGLATGGNKVRKLEFLLGAAEAAGADHVITFGALQSNHARQTAAACAIRGLACDLILVRRVTWDDPSYETSGNLLLDPLFGASVHRVEDARESGELLQRRMAEIARSGGRVAVIPPGGSNAIGALGYVECALELGEQFAGLDPTPEAVWVACSTLGTQAGLVVGIAATAVDARIIGVDVYSGDAAHQQSALRALCSDVADLLGVEAPRADRLIVDSDHLGADYGIPHEGVFEAIELVARCEGILLDPVYSGKAMAALISHIRTGRCATDRPVVFVHTGGSAGLFAYPQALRARV